MIVAVQIAAVTASAAVIAVHAGAHLAGQAAGGLERLGGAEGGAPGDGAVPGTSGFLVHLRPATAAVWALQKRCLPATAAVWAPLKCCLSATAAVCAPQMCCLPMSGRQMNAVRQRLLSVLCMLLR